MSQLTVNPGEPAVSSEILRWLKHADKWPFKVKNALVAITDVKTDFNNGHTYYTHVHVDGGVRTLYDVPMHRNKTFILELEGRSHERADQALFTRAHYPVLVDLVNSERQRAQASARKQYDRRIADLEAELAKAKQDRANALEGIDARCDQVLAHVEPLSKGDV